MSEYGYLKCPCQKCGAHIEFPETGVGLTIDCPHCHERTTLSASGQEADVESPGENAPSASVPEGATPQAARGFRLIGAGILVLIILAVVGGAIYWPGPRKPAGTATTNAVSQPRTKSPAPTNPAQPTYEMNRFHVVGAISLEKAASGGIVYAVGTVKNDAASERFGVRIDLDEMDKNGNNIGSASDYVAVMEPNAEWRFRALLTDPKVVTVRMGNLGEQK